MTPKLRQFFSLLLILFLSLFHLDSSLGVRSVQALRNRIPPLDFFLNMPYDKFVSGKAPELEKPPEKLPALAQGEIVVFFLTNKNEIKLSLPKKEHSFMLSSPQKNLNMDIFVKKQGVDVFKGKKIFSPSVHEQVNIALKKDQVTYDTVKGNVSINLLAVVRKESIVSQKADIKTKVSSVGVKVENSKSANIKVKESGVAIKQEASGLDVATTSSELIVEKQDAGVQIEFGAKDSVHLEVSGDQGGDTTTAVVISAPHVSGTAELGGTLVDESSLMVLFDESLLEYFSGENYLSGFNDSGELVAFSGSKIMEGKWDQSQFVPDLEEQNAFKELINSEPEIMQLLDRPFSRVFREDQTAKGEFYQCDISFEFIPKAKYHGHPVGAMISITNKGNAYMYDATVAWGIPQHSKFLEFFEKDTYSKGFSAHHLENLNLVLLKLYRPIAPGETFKSLVFFTLDPWNAVE